MKQSDIEKMLKRIIQTNEMLAVAQANITEINGLVVDIILTSNRQRDEPPKPVMQ